MLERKGEKNVNFEKMFYLQKVLDDRIMQEHHLDERNVIQERILALEVELGELANETRCFKYWSTKAPSERKVILEEYVDGVHFILSLGLSLQYTQIDDNTIGYIEKKSNNVEAFQTVFDQVSRFNGDKSFSQYKQLLQAYLTLGRTLGFEEGEIEAAYLQKNEVNHRRQDEGY